MQKYLAELTDPRPLVDPTISVEDNLHRLRDLRTNLTFEHDRIQRAATLIDNKNSEWAQLMTNLDDDERAAEQTLYDTAAKGADGFATIWNSAQEQLSLIHAWQFDVDTTIASLLSSPSPAASAMPPPGPPANSGPGGPPAPQPVVTQPVLRLPKLEMTPFSGDLRKWREFWDTYESSVHNQHISNVQKFTYLKSFLRDDALRTVEGIAICNDNYQEAIDLLKKRFGDDKKVKRELYTDLRGLPKVTSSRTTDLRGLVDSMEKICRQLNTMGEDLDHHSLSGIVMEKLPKYVVSKLEEQYKNHK